MYTDYSVDEVLQTVNCFIENIDKTGEEFNKNCDLLEAFYIKQLEQICREEELQTATQNLIKNECQKQEDVRRSLEENRKVLEGLETNIAKLQEVKLEKENAFSKLEKEVDTTKKKIQSHLEVREDINMKKDIILAYKLLTNTSFVYTTKRVMGIVEKEPPKRFNYNPQNLSPEEITEQLWHLVLEETV